ncbi:uncharacterized protein LOC113602901 isoform X1 [Acinonyx jubatus]|uniref:Uncharacterized protein LOC113602901 isoform X1 n=1 Tax=Acinonyx jubatus TaxID=32536 RepID=A0A6J2AD02_ACIJB|nr:uncharacterized protein LOC113602901 isoform X1 [Acinonyx jubatus]
MRGGASAGGGACAADMGGRSLRTRDKTSAARAEVDGDSGGGIFPDTPPSPLFSARAESHRWRLPEHGGGVESRPGRRKADCPQLALCAFQEVTRRDVGASQPKALGARRDETGPGACGQVSSGRTQPGPGVPSPSPARAPPAFLSSVGLLASRPGGFFLTCQGSTHPTHAARGETRPVHTPVSILSCCTGVKFTSVPRPPPRSSWIERTTAGHRQGALLIAPCTGHMLGLGTQCPGQERGGSRKYRCGGPAGPLREPHPGGWADLFQKSPWLCGGGDNKGQWQSCTEWGQ